MFERFDEKAINAIMLAQEESKRLGHSFVGPEQLLLGLIAEETGVAAEVLMGMGVKLNNARIEVEKIIGRGSGCVEELPFTNECKQILEFSLKEAKQLGHNYIGTEHLLLGLTLVKKREVAIAVLENLQVDLFQVRNQVIQTLTDAAPENAAPQEVEENVPIIWNVGDVIQNLYEVTGILGEGGFGKVYKVRHRGWNIDLAVKIPKPEIVAAVGGVKNFESEAKTWVNLGLHPHIVSCYYVRRIDSNPVLFAEYVAGGSLHDCISSRNLYAGGETASLPRILDIAIQFAWGLHYAHDQKLIHQDVKPANVMLTLESLVKVTDFGIANTKAHLGKREDRVSANEHRTLMVTGSGTMTPAYCSPEQAKGESLTRRTDLWSWALSVLEMFQGERTWHHGTVAAQSLKSYLETEPKDPQLPQMPKSVEQLLWRCFQENPNERPHNMQEVALALQEIYQQVKGKAYPRKEPNTGKDIADSLNNRAVSLLDLGRREEALELWKQALQVQPQHPESTYNRGLILWRTASITDDTLVREIEEVRKSHAGNWRIDYLLGLVHLERDDCLGAIIKTLEGIQGAEAEREEVKATIAIAQKHLHKSKKLLRTFEAHRWGINSAYLSADGKLALSGNWHGNLKLWDVATGRCLSTWEGHTGMVNSVYLSVDSRFAVSGSEDKTLKLWNVNTGRCLRTFKGHRDEVNSVCLSKDSDLALSGSRDRTLKLWDINTGHCLYTFIGHTDEVNSVCLSAASRLALSGSMDRTLKLWEMKTGRCLRTFTGHTDEVNSVCLSADSRFALSGSRDQTLKLWNIDTGRCLRTFTGHTGEVNSVCLSADFAFALSASNDKTLKLWEVATGRCLRTFEGHTSLVTSVCLSGDNKFAVSSELDKEILKLWVVNSSTNPYTAPMMLSRVLATETILDINQIFEQELKHAKVDLDRGEFVAAAQHIRKARSQPGYSHNSEAVKVWTSLYVRLPRKSFLSGWESITFSGHKSRVNTVYLSADSRFALSGSSDCTLKLWEVDTGRCLGTFTGHSCPIISVYQSADNQIILSLSVDGILKQWGNSTNRYLRTFVVPKELRREFNSTDRGKVNTVCLSADNQLALSGNNEKTLNLWDLSSGRCLHTFKGHTDNVTSVCLSADSRLALSGSKDKTLKLWEVSTGRCIRTFKGHADEVISVYLSADSRVALSLSRDCILKLWNVDTGSCLPNFAEHAGAVTSAYLSLDGRYVLSGMWDSKLKLWDVNTGSCLRTFEGHTSAVTSVCLSLDCSYILSGSKDGMLKLWVLDWELEYRQPADWDEGARTYLKTFLTLQTPCHYDNDRPWWQFSSSPVLERRGTPKWNNQDFQNLLYTLGCAGYGWLKPEGIRKQLAAMADISPKSLPLPENNVEEKAPSNPDSVVGVVSRNLPVSPEEISPTLSVEISPDSTGQPSLIYQNNQMPAKVILTVTKGSLKGKKFVFEERTTCIIGRARDCGEHQLPDDKAHRAISRYHCLLDINPPDIRVQDIGSKHGTYVNGQKIGQRLPEQTPEEGAKMNFPEYDLQSGDEIKLCHTVFQVNIQVAEVNEPPEPLPEPPSEITKQHLVLVQPDRSNLISIQGYTTLRLLGRGGCGEVYLVRHNQTEEEVALKVMLPHKSQAANRRAIEMFQREAENTQALEHPNVVRLLTSGYSNGTFFFTLEYCDGGSIADLIKQRNRQGLPIDEAVQIILQVLDGLEYAHQAEIPYVQMANGTFGCGQGLVHRDLKPSNIFLTNKDGSPIAKIGDYGLAKAFDFAGLSGLTRSGDKGGTCYYMPRQQVINFKYAKPEVDVWATAASLYNMLTGYVPRNFTKEENGFLTVLNSSAVPIRQRNTSIPQRLAELIDLALKDDQTLHFKDAASFKQALLDVI